MLWAALVLFKGGIVIGIICNNITLDNFVIEGSWKIILFFFFLEKHHCGFF